MVNAKSLMHISSYYLNDSSVILIIFVKVLLAISHICLRVCIFRVQDAGGLRESDSVSEMDHVFHITTKCSQSCALLLLYPFTLGRHVETQSPLLSNNLKARGGSDA